jgi:nucleotide-binding universal stress UspA family protein
MIKDVMVRLDGSSGDDARLAAVTQIARMFEGHITGLFFAVASEGHAEAGGKSADPTENLLFERLDRLQLSAVLRRLDVKDELDISETALPVVRTADVFVALRPNSGPSEPKDLIENVLFGGGRHLFLAPENWTGFTPLENILVAWNGSRESARAMAEASPYLRQAERVGVLVVEGEGGRKTDPMKANDAVLHLRHHGIDAVKYRAVGEEDDTADLLVEQCRSFGANLLVMGSYGHSAQHDLLPGSTTSRMLRISPVPLLIAH